MFFKLSFISASLSDRKFALFVYLFEPDEVRNFDFARFVSVAHIHCFAAVGIDFASAERILVVPVVYGNFDFADFRIVALEFVGTIDDAVAIAYAGEHADIGITLLTERGYIQVFIVDVADACRL